MSDTRPEAIIADLLVSTLFAAYNDGRRHLYCWERKGLRYLRDIPSRGPINDWTATFIKVNDPSIEDESVPINWNLRAYREREAMCREKEAKE